MTRETKVGLLVGMAIILLVGIVVSDHLSKVQEQEPARLTEWAPEAQNSVSPFTSNPTDPFNRASNTPQAQRIEPIPLPTEISSTPEAIERPRHPAPTPRVDVDRDRFTQAFLNRPDLTGGDPTPPPAIRLDNATRTTPGMSPGVTPETPFGSTPSSSTNTNTATTQSPASEVTIHDVVPGQTLYEIANLHYGSGDYWRSIRDANPDLVAADGNVKVGVRLQIPRRAGLAPPTRPTADNASVLTTQTPAAGIPARVITVQAGDTLSDLAQAHLGSGRRWQELLDANKDQIKSPEQLRVGMKLRLPGAAPAAAGASSPAAAPAARSGNEYVVKAGDSLSTIAERTLGGARHWRRVFDANRDKLKDPDSLQLGMTLRIPANP